MTISRSELACRNVFILMDYAPQIQDSGESGKEVLDLE